MRASANSVIELCRERYDDILEYHRLNDGAEEFVSQFGEFSQDYVNQASSEIEERMLEDGDRKVVVKRMFSIIVEGLQNIRLHGEKDKEGNQTSFFLLLRNEDHYFIYLGNLVLKNNVEKIQARINQVNEMDKVQVKELYLSVLTNGVISNKGGAGLGFITMSMKSLNQLDGSFVEIDDEISHYDLKIKLDRKK
jgi:hypothetical protein